MLLVREVPLTPTRAGSEILRDQTAVLYSPRVTVWPYATLAPMVWAAVDEARPELARWAPDIARHHTLAQIEAGLADLAAARGRRERTYAMSHLGLLRLEANVALENSASRRVAETVGFPIRGHRPVVRRWDGNASEMLIYVLTNQRSLGGS